MNEPHPCPGCATVIGPGQGLCSPCLLSLVKYPLTSPVLLKYALAGVRELETMLERHAEFAEWLALHPSRT